MYTPQPLPFISHFRFCMSLLVLSKSITLCFVSRTQAITQLAEKVSAARRDVVQLEAAVKQQEEFLAREKTNNAELIARVAVDERKVSKSRDAGAFGAKKSPSCFAFWNFCFVSCSSRNSRLS